ncbi:hypothetical protein JCM12856_21920 [Spirochaeta dissipatitropha]
MKDMLVCMRTTLNIPDELVQKAKRLALRDGVTLTDMLVSGLSQRVAQSEGTFRLPVSSSGGGLCSGISWDDLSSADSEKDWYR